MNNPPSTIAKSRRRIGTLCFVKAAIRSRGSQQETPYTPARRQPPQLSEAPRSERNSVGRSMTTTQSSSKIGLLFDAFYGHLEEHSPELKPLFRSSLRIKGKILVHISAGMRSILGSENAAEKMAALNKTHVRFGVQLHHFNSEGKTLLFAMDKVSDDVWMPEVADAWRRLFAHCSAILLVLQQRATPRQEPSTALSQRERPSS